MPGGPLRTLTATAVPCFKQYANLNYIYFTISAINGTITGFLISDFIEGFKGGQN